MLLLFLVMRLALPMVQLINSNMGGEVKKDYKKGDIIEFAKDRYKVLINHGESGTVQEYPNGDIVSNFYWKFEGEECILVARKEIEVTGCTGGCSFFHSKGFYSCCEIEHKEIPQNILKSLESKPDWCPLKSGPIIVRLKG